MRLLVIAAAGAAAAALTACASMDEGAPSAASAASPVAATTPDVTATNAAAYLPEAGRSDQFEIQSSQLALSQGSSSAVKGFAQTMIRDHTESTKALMGAAQRAGMTPPPPPPLDARRQGMLDQLRAAQGSDFDRLYLQQQLMAHQEAYALHSGYAKAGDQPALRGAASTISRTVQQHLDMLKTMAPA